jgi:hypothetical protein
MRSTVGKGIGGITIVFLAGMALLGLEGGKDMTGTPATASSGAAIPPIDAAAPTVTERATFALG